MNKSKMIGLAFLLTGLILVSIPIYYEWKNGNEVRALEEALSLITEYESEYEELEDALFTVEELKAVLELEIPSIDLKQKILKETTDDNLKIALTQLKNDQFPGKGNFTIAGHRGYRGNRFFSRLPEVSTGDQVFLHTNSETFIYKVTDIRIIEPSDVEILEDRAGKAEITMITCTRSGNQRFAVRGELVERNG